MPERVPRRSARVGVWLLLLALLPLLGASTFVIQDLRSATDVRDRARKIDASAREIVLLNQFRAALLDERNWASAAAGLDELGIADDDIVRLLGFSVTEKLTSSIATVDNLMQRLDNASIASSVRALRDAPIDSFTGVGFAYADYEREIAELSQRDVDQLLVIAGTIGGGSGLVDVLRILESATLARQAVTSQLTEYFAVEFASSYGAESNVDTLVEHREIYVLAMAQIVRISLPGSHVAETLERIDGSTAVGTFADAVNALTTAFNAGNGDPSSAAREEDGADPLAELVSTFLAADESSNRHLELVDAAGTDVTDVSMGLIDGAEADRRAVVTRILIVTVTSLIGAYAIAQVIGRPLRQLSAAARRLRDGDVGTELVPSGPSEVREAGRAISEAAGHLDLATRQARALAQGTFDHPVLAQSASGTLGASLQDALQTLVTSLSDREEFRRLLAHEATHDPLTQLANRRAVMARLSESLARTRRNDARIAVMFLDLDEFKGVNDQHGHPAGDAVLRAISQRLLLAVRRGDQVGRLGGDEFLIVAEPVTDIDEALALARRLLEAVGTPIAHEDDRLAVSASIGIALVDQESTLGAEEVLREADLAVYQAKAMGRSRIEVCDDELRAEIHRRKVLEDAIRAAIEHDDLVLHYQEIVDSRTTRPFAYEALVRWQHADDGLRSPAAFIPFAERSDLILEIDRWVIKAAVAQLVAWSSDELRRTIPISVNVSGRHLAVEGFVEAVLSPLRVSGVDPTRLIIEVTESALLDDLDGAAVTLSRLRAHGVRVAIDDFGTGYTSLAHLRTLPFDILKIDQSFVKDPEAESIVKLIIDTGHLLGARITAEGVETAAQAEALTALGADELQGYFFSRPSPPDRSDTPGELLGKL